MADPYLEKLLGKDEKVLLVTRQHWTVLLWHILPEILLIAGIIVLATVGVVAVQGTPLLALAYLLLLLPLIWAYHKYVVTSRRVIQLMGVINKNVIDSSLEKVNDVKMEQSAWGRIFDYGDIEILTASEMGINRFTRIARPIQLKTAMLNAKGALDGGGISLLAQLDNLHKLGVLSDAELAAKKADLLKKGH